MGGKEEEEAGDVAVKMPEATLKIFNGVQVGLHHYASTFCSQSNRGGGGIAREFLGCIRKKPFHGVYSCSQLNSIRGVSVGRFVRFHAVILSPEEREEGEAREFIISLNY